EQRRDAPVRSVWAELRSAQTNTRSCRAEKFALLATFLSSLCFSIHMKEVPRGAAAAFPLRKAGERDADGMSRSRRERRFRPLLSSTPSLATPVRPCPVNQCEGGT